MSITGVSEWGEAFIKSKDLTGPDIWEEGERQGGGFVFCPLMLPWD